jgi:nicotinate-nucleotide pyrophosphorylase (carboxylating)
MVDPLGSVPMVALDAHLVQSEVRRFLAEDVGAGDVTTRSIVSASARTRAALVARESCVIAGLACAAAVFSELDPHLRLELVVGDGARLPATGIVAMIAGRTQPILTGERVALNLLQRLSGIATVTRRYVDEVAGTGVSISDTRKTTPGLRAFEKYAVRVGGGRNHRFGLDDAVLIKDNHIAAAGGIASALGAIRATGVQGPLQIEVDALDQLSEALDLGVDAVLLDNMRPDMVVGAVRRIRTHARGASCWIEASGGITLANVRSYADAGVDTISIGALTHSAPAVDLALDLTIE